MWIRFTRHKYLTPLAPHVAICGSGRRYVWTGADGGAIDVPYQADLEWLLNPPGHEGESVYKLAYERHGIAFDEAGKEMEPIPCETRGSGVSVNLPEFSAPVMAEAAPVAVRKRGRPKRR